MTQDDALNVGQADACSFKLIRMMKALKHSEEILGIVHIEAHPIIANGYHHLIRRLARLKKRKKYVGCFRPISPATSLMGRPSTSSSIARCSRN